MILTDATIFDAIENPGIWARWFRNPATWRGWFAFLRVLFGLDLDADGLELFRRCTGRGAAPAGGVNETWLVCGRRAGKSFVLALIAVFLAAFRDWRPYLTPGERATIMVLAADRRQARVIFRYARALLQEVPALAALVERAVEEQIDLANGVSIEISAASYRTVRGYTLVAALCDEIAFWRSEDSANPDDEILAALRPAMATVPGAMLLCASSPYARRGALWSAYRRHWAKDGPALIWRADTRTMNPTVAESIIMEAYEADPASAAAEYGAEFRTDVDSFVAREVVEAAAIPGRYELPPVPRTSYVAFTDPSGGSSDAFTLAIAHGEDNRGLLDCVREFKPPFSPEAVVAEFAETLKHYSIREVTGDRYAGEWPRERFREHGIDYKTSERSKSDIYRELLPLLNSGKVELLDNTRLINQISALERRTARGGRDSVDHGPGGHDDLANACAGALVAVMDGDGIDYAMWAKLAGR
jgi:hypothetical protein